MWHLRCGTLNFHPESEGTCLRCRGGCSKVSKHPRPLRIRLASSNGKNTLLVGFVLLPVGGNLKIDGKIIPRIILGLYQVRRCRVVILRKYHVPRAHLTWRWSRCWSWSRRREARVGSGEQERIYGQPTTGNQTNKSHFVVDSVSYADGR